MEWTPNAEAAIRKVPFFIRKKVKASVEKEAAEAGLPTVNLAQVKLSRRRFTARMDSEIKGYQLDTCFGAGGCPNRAADTAGLVKRLEALLGEADLLGFLRQTVNGPLKYHHEFRVGVAECPNACSQPQIKDIGIIAAAPVFTTAVDCSACMDCVAACPDDAVAVDPVPRPAIDPGRCLDCGRCAAACPTGTIAVGAPLYRVLLAGKLGRHPRLARPSAPETSALAARNPTTIPPNPPNRDQRNRRRTLPGRR
jgi:anaerobic sulfite reductase subunit C